MTYRAPAEKLAGKLRSPKLEGVPPRDRLDGDVMRAAPNERAILIAAQRLRDIAEAAWIIPDRPSLVTVAGALRELADLLEGDALT